MGHALDNTLQDIITRWKRMKGFSALWLPGTDHASIATEVKVVDKLRNEGIDKDEIGREGFLERAWEWKEEYGNRITNQLRKMGSSCDWSRERFTLDKGCSEAVKEVFIKLYERGLIYQGDYIVNWCPDCHTTLSDIEVEHEDHEGKFYHIKYPLKDSDEYIEIATTRPETMLGDTAVAVHPDDPRYADVVGREIILPLTERKIPVVADSYVDREFGTGAVKVTPAHDPNDWGIGERHNLDKINILSPEGKMINVPSRYQGLSIKETRKKVIEDLKTEGLFIKETPHLHQVGHCYRCNTRVEPYLSEQWFVRMQRMAEKALQAWEQEKIRFFPKRWENTYTH